MKDSLLSPLQWLNNSGTGKKDKLLNRSQKFRDRKDDDERLAALQESSGTYSFRSSSFAFGTIPWPLPILRAIFPSSKEKRKNSGPFPIEQGKAKFNEILHLTRNIYRKVKIENAQIDIPFSPDLQSSKEKKKVKIKTSPFGPLLNLKLLFLFPIEQTRSSIFYDSPSLLFVRVELLCSFASTTTGKVVSIALAALKAERGKRLNEPIFPNQGAKDESDRATEPELRTLFLLDPSLIEQ
ncbi:hypothetical protein SDJN03_23733, partial [Cucurbita argyrosperma subsp. sororia]